MKIAFFCSIFLNIIFIGFGGYIIYKKGGIEYLKRKISQTRQEHHVSYYTKKSVFEVMPKDPHEIVFLGDLITDNCDWNELFGDVRIKNRGLAGEDIVGLIDRLDNIVSSQPEKIFLMIGANDLNKKYTIQEILKNYEEFIVLLHKKSPETKLYIQSILPTYKDLSRNNKDIMAINSSLENLATRYNSTYINLFDLFKSEKNELDMTYSFDGVHLNGKGYIHWKNIVESYITD